MTKLQEQRTMQFKNRPKYVILGVRALNLEILFNSNKNVLKRTCALVRAYYAHANV